MLWTECCFLGLDCPDKSIMILLLCPTVAALFRLVRLPLQSDARCLDGSPHAFYYEEGSAANKDKFVVFFDSGGLCAGGSLQDSLLECYKRSFGSLGSTAKLNQTVQNTNTNILSGKASESPFWDWTRVFVVYCDGTEYQGYIKETVRVKDRDLYFRGYNNTKGVIDYLGTNFGMFAGSKVIMTGTSAGGIASFLWSNYLSSRMLNPDNLVVAPDSGLFLVDYVNPFTKRPEVILRVKPLFDFVLKDVGLSMPECNVDEATMINCFNAVNLLKFLKAKHLMLIESPYDMWSINNILGLDCVGDRPGTLDNCSLAQVKAIEDYRAASLAAIAQFRNYSGIGIWSPACIQHGFVENQGFSNSSFRVPSGTGLRLSEAMQLFAAGQKVQLVDLGAWPSNSGCSGRPQQSFFD